MKSAVNGPDLPRPNNYGPRPRRTEQNEMDRKFGVIKWSSLNVTGDECTPDRTHEYFEKIATD